MTRVRRAVLIACLWACTGRPPDPPTLGALVVDPAHQELGVVPIHEVRLVPLKLTNPGPGPITLLSLEELTGSRAFSTPPLPQRVLERGKQLVINPEFAARSTVQLTEHEAKYLFRTDNGDVTATAHATSAFVRCSLGLLDLGAVLLGESQEHTFQLINESPLPATLAIGEPVPFAGDPRVFARFDAGTYPLAAGEAFPLTLRFTPAGLATYVVVAELRMSPLCPPVDVTLRGQGVSSIAVCVEGQFTATGGRLEVLNLGIAPLQLVDLAVTGNFTLLTDGGVTVPGARHLPGLGASPSRATIPIAFRPALSGEHHGTFTASTGHPGQPMLSCPLIGRN